MSDELKPALTADEYLCGTTPLPATKGLRRLRAQRTVSGLGIEGQAHVAFSDLPALIGLAIDSLPVYSPYKITREDLRFLSDAADEYILLRPLLAKIAALLPPETTSAPSL